MTVVPGFIDAHCHPSGVEELYGVNTNLRTVREIQAAISAEGRRRRAPEVWITGFMFDDTKLDRPLTRKDLDEATTEHPVSVAHRGGHTNFYNSKAFELAGITGADARSAGRPILQGERRTERPRRRERTRRVRPRRQAGDLHARAAARSRAQGHGAHVEAVQRRRPDDGAQRR